MVFHWSLSNSESPKVSRTLLSILADLNNAVVWVVSALLISNFSSPHPKPLESFRVHRLQSVLPSTSCSIPLLVVWKGPSTYLSFRFLYFIFTLRSTRTTKSTIQQVAFIIIIIYSFRVFHISISWWFFTGVWVTASLLKSPGLVSGFWQFSAILSFG